MNVLFLLVFLLSAGYFLIFAPDRFLPVMLGGAEKAAALALALLAVYSVWMGFTQVLQDTGITDKISHGMRPLLGKLFATEDEQAAEYLSLNLSANMLGISGAATPFGIKAAERLDLARNPRYSQSMLLVVNATSVQILPTTVLAILASYGAESPASIVLPSLLSSLFGTLLGVGMVWLFLRKTGNRQPFYKRITAKGKA